jgi:hypothetical protein
MSRYRILAVFGGLFLLQSMVFSEENSAQKAGDKLDFDQIIRDLGAREWPERKAAREKLLDWGYDHKQEFAYLVLEKWPQQDDPEIRYNLIQSLKTVVLESEYHKGAFLGIRMGQSLVPLIVDGQSYYPIEVSQTLPGCVAMEEGIRAGDKILQIDSQVCNNLSFRTEHFVEYIRNKKPGSTITLRLWSNGRVFNKDIKLGERPAQYNEDISETLRQEQFFQDWIRSYQVKKKMNQPAE